MITTAPGPSPDVVTRIAAAIRHAPLALSLTGVIVLSHFVNEGHDFQRVLQLAFFLVFAVACAAFARRAPAQPAMPASLRHTLFAVLGLGVASSLLSYSPRHGLLEVLSLTCLVLVALTVAREMRTDFHQKLMHILLGLGAGMTAYLVLIAVIALGVAFSGAAIDPYVFAPGFSNYRFLNHAQTISIPLLVLLACTCRPEHRRAWLVVACCWFLPLFALAGRGTVLGLVVAAVVVLVIQRRRAALYCRTMAVAGAAGLASYWLIFMKIPALLGFHPYGLLGSVVARSISDPVSSRDRLFSRGLDLILADPVLGAGPMHYAHYAADLDIAAHPHNHYLQIASEWGLPALALVLFGIWFAARAVLKTRTLAGADDERNHLILTAWIFTGVAILVDGLVSGLIIMPVSQLLIALYLGCAGGWVWSRQESSGMNLPQAAQWPLAAALLAGAVGLLILAVPDLPGYLAGTLASDKPMDLRGLHPRFWVEGFF